ncbi:MAG: hypothetical protein D6767_06735 [Candidatus Hydrogenedentota bacterium]|nr:MAG: hypothetical protein D6767_06735 [Candidatus Hydrogenedentota bacterium]
MVLKKIFGLTVILMLLSSCEKASHTTRYKPKTKEEILEKRLIRFFSAGYDKDNPFVGVWQANTKDLQKLLKEKFLAKYKAKPDEASKKLLESRLKEVKNYIRLLPLGQALMMSVSYNGVPGMSSGTWKKRTKNKIEIHWKNKKKKVQAMATLLDKNKFLYVEALGKISYVRFTKSAKEEARNIIDKLRSFGSLPEY